MGKRGPDPPNLGLLTVWEFEFYKAFRFLRDGMSLPPTSSAPLNLARPEIRQFVTRLKQMNDVEYWRTTQKLAVELGQSLNLFKPPVWSERVWAEQQRLSEITALERMLKPPTIEAQAKRRKIWTDLVEANTYASLRKVCGRWSQLPDVRWKGLVPFPGHVVANSQHFLSMKLNKRFPRSSYGDDARLEYLARGMAGVMTGRSPMTGIERLRNMSHRANGPLWDQDQQLCKCWRCGLKRSAEVYRRSEGWYENGLRLFIEIAGPAKNSGTKRKQR